MTVLIEMTYIHMTWNCKNKKY